MPGLLGPLVVPVHAAAFVRAGVVGWRRGGVRWRGTLYPSAALGSGRRLALPPRHLPDRGGPEH